VVGVDGSFGSDVALSWARREAATRGWGLTAVLAWDYLTQPGAVVGLPFDVGYGEESAREALAAYIERAPEADGLAQGVIDQQVVCDLPAAGLVAVADAADLLVVGARGHGRIRRLTLGSVSEQVLAKAPGDVVVVPEGAGAGRVASGERKGRIVVGTDGSEGSAAAVRWALDAGRAHRSVVEVVHAWEASPLGGGFPVTATVHPRSWYEHAAQEVLDKSLVGMDVNGLPAVERLALEGPAVPTILARAGNADLLVVSPRGLGGLKAALAGSVSRPLVHRAAIPVAVVKGPHR
jgi:nucleotide-binding universal stress UspA family protein